ncbi:ROK family protein [Vibrio sp. SS-MA-C1-2]|uniref:ROK family protein n=1 Tax=Vibrio sp. SS-MA-C1-2 TaxID=2908646 RepID=UPI001F1F8527|nr:ROK family protein [Vibrio sp. SS-MA-C1-2]UJF17452.1 ROK family protein [Vibrio sp. SS-MA-C1-2]
MSKEILLAFDIGGTQVKYGVVTKEGEILEKGAIDTSHSGDEIVANIVKIKNQLAKQYPLHGASFSMPGFVDVNSGYLETAGAIYDFYGLNFRDLMLEKLGLPVELDNDVNCVAMAEKWLGNGKGIDNFLCFTIGTGIGGAVVINNQIVRGHNFRAGEFGFTLANNPFKAERKGNGLSDTASIYGGLRKKLVRRKPELNFDETSGKDVYRLAENGNKDAQQVIEAFYQSIAIGIYNLTFALNPQKVLLGGAISAREEIYPEITKALQYILEREAPQFKVQVSDFVTLESTAFNNDSGIIGAAHHFFMMAETRK